MAMKKNDLLERLRRLGFPLLEAQQAQDANTTLADWLRVKICVYGRGFRSY